MYNGIIILIALDVLNNLLDQRWPPKMSEIAVYTVLELCHRPKGISFLYYVEWNTVLPKLLFHIKPHPPSIS